MATLVPPVSLMWRSMKSVAMVPPQPREESEASMRQRLSASLSQSCPGVTLTQGLDSAMDDEDESQQENSIDLSHSCFAEIRLEKGTLDDDELTSLTWLQDQNLLKTISGGAGEVLRDSPISDLLDDPMENGVSKVDGKEYGHQHPPNVPYNPKIHVNSKPPYSFSCLIFMAIEESSNKALPVKDIYSWILSHFPYFQNAPTGWKNSVRHNLSLNKCFRKVDKEKGQNIGKGSLWCIDPDYRPNLLQALRKTPYHPYHQLQMLTAQPITQMTHLPSCQKPLPLAPRINFNIPSPHLFPLLSKRLAASSMKDPEVDAAATMLALKNGPRIQAEFKLNHLRSENGIAHRRRFKLKTKFRTPILGTQQKLQPSDVPVITLNPSEDHTYSYTTSPTDAGSISPSSSIDDPFDFGDEDGEVSDSNLSNASFYTSEEEEEDLQKFHVERTWSKLPDDEEMKIVEGADALLNLAGIKTSNIVPLRSISPQNNNNHLIVGKSTTVIR